MARPRSPYCGHHITRKSERSTRAPRAQAASARLPARPGLSNSRNCHDRQRRLRRSGGVPLSGRGVDGARPVAQHPGRLSRRPHGARALAGRAQRADHAHLARGPAGLHRLARARRRAAALHRAAAVELPALLPLLPARGVRFARIPPRRSPCRRSAARCRSSLTEEEVESLLGAPVVSDPLGNRDRTMLEVLYATGPARLGAGEPAPGQVNLNQGVIRILGKGDRERLIPLGEEAMRCAEGVRARPARRRSCSSGRPITCSRPAAAIA